MEHSKQKADAVIKADKKVMVRDIIAWLGIGHSAMQEMISKLTKDIDLNQGNRNCCTLM
jgi:hypothetical protein